MPFLSANEIETFHHQGYLVIEDLIDAATLSAIQDEYATVMDRHYATWHQAGWVPPVTADGGPQFWEKLGHCIQGGFDWYQPFDISLPHADITHDTPMHIGPAVFNMMTHPDLLDRVESLIGGEITSNPIQHVRIKPPIDLTPESETRAHIVQTDWHQDMGVTLPEADRTTFITIWLAITDATVENGCLQVAQKADQLLPHCPIRQQVALPDDLLDTDQRNHAIPVPVPAGGGVIFHPFTPHASLQNRTPDQYRWSFDLRYNVTGQATGRSHFPDFVARSRRHPERVLTDWQVLSDMWHQTRATLARTPHIPQHRWDPGAAYCA